MVEGPPWNTHVAVRGKVTGELPEGESYEKVLFQAMHIRWGHVTRIETLENTQVLEATMARMYWAGVAEAKAPPITDSE